MNYVLSYKNKQSYLRVQFLKTNATFASTIAVYSYHRPTLIEIKKQKSQNSLKQRITTIEQG